MNSRCGIDALLADKKWVGPIAFVLIAIGTLSRLAPLTDPHVRLLRQFMTEDGYLMQTVAHNLAVGLGFTVSDGTVQTNGVQPLATFIFSLFYLLSGGDKIKGIAGVALFSVLVSLAAAGLLYLLARKVLKEWPDEKPLALLIASLWFASPLIVKQSMNGLETGLYFLVSLAALNTSAIFAEKNPHQFTLKQMLILGVLFGVCFLVRNDAVFLIAAILLARFALLWPKDGRAWRDRIMEAAIPGLVSILIALPWLFYNYSLFGSIVPISGIAESQGARFGQNLMNVPALLIENVMIIVPIPNLLETKLLTICLAISAVALAIVMSAKFLWTRPQSRQFVVLTYSIFAGLVISFYGLLFGAPWFLARYLSILSPFFAFIGVIAVYRFLLSTQSRLRRVIFPLAATGAGVLVLGVNGLLYRNGLHHDHFQVVEWVEAHVTPQTWVGAIQTGTLGFFHDRTVNLDGKVNPEALRANLTEGDIIPYVLRSQIMVLIDWYGIAAWSRIERGGFNQKFELLLADENANLAVLRRVDRDARPVQSVGEPVR